MNNMLSVSRIDRIRTSARQIVRDLGFMHTHIAGTQLSPSAVHTIIELGYGTVTNASALGELLRLEKSSISRLLKKLERSGLVRIDTSPSDKRVHNLGLTPQGTILLHQIEEYARRLLRSALGKITDEELKTVEDGLFAFANSLGTNEATSVVPDFNLDIKTGYQTGLIAAVTDIHAAFYGENYGFGAVFERKVATEISEFMGRIDRPVNTIISAYRGDRLLGSVSLDGEDLGDRTAHLRWFIVSPSARGLGLGKQLIEKACAFVDEIGFRQTRLWTFQGLDAARHLYESAGFTLADEKPGSQWGNQVVEQEFIRQNPF